MTKNQKFDENKIDDKLTYEQKVEKLDEILTGLDNSETPIDKLAEDVKQGARLIKELGKKLQTGQNRSP